MTFNSDYFKATKALAASDDSFKGLTFKKISLKVRILLRKTQNLEAA
jgi:hypothetical protein